MRSEAAGCPCHTRPVAGKRPGPSGFSRQDTWVDLRRGWMTRWVLELSSSPVSGEPSRPGRRSTVQTTLTRVCPYRGLLFFREEDTQSFFFGRETPSDNYTRPSKRTVSSRWSAHPAAASLRRPRRACCDAQGQATRLGNCHGRAGDRHFHALAGALLPMLEPHASEVDRLGRISLPGPAVRGGDGRTP